MKYTNLKRGLVGVCAATMLTGLCAVPAFAADVDSQGKGTTTVNATVDAQLSVTVPTTLTATVGDDGVLTYADNATIENKSQLASVHVSSIEVNAVDGTLVKQDEFAAASSADTAWTKVKANGVAASEVDLQAFVASANWDIAAASGATQADYGKLPVTFAGELKNPSKTGDINVFNIVWTVSFGNFA